MVPLIFHYFQYCSQSISNAVWYLTTELYNSFLEDLVSPEKDPMKWVEMWWDDQLSSSIRPPGWHSRWTRRTWWRCGLRRSRQMPAGWTGKEGWNRSAETWLHSWATNEAEEDTATAAAYYIREVSGRGVQEEVLAFCSGKGRGGGGLGTSWLRLNRRGIRHGRKLRQLMVYINISIIRSNLKLKLSKINTIQPWCP